MSEIVHFPVPIDAITLPDGAVVAVDGLACSTTTWAQGFFCATGDQVTCKSCRRTRAFRERVTP